MNEKLNFTPILTLGENKILKKSQLEDSQDNHSKDSSVQQTNNFLNDFMSLYSYADKRQKIVIIVGIILGIGSGISHPLFIYLWFQQLQLAIEKRYDLDSNMDQIMYYLYAYFALGCGVLIVNSALFVIWKYVSQSVSKRIRIRYLEEFTKQSLTNVEIRNGYEWINDFRTHTLNIEKSIGDKVALFFNLIGITSSGVIAAIWIRWTYALYLLLVAPLGAIALVYFIYVQIKKQDVLKEANKAAQQKVVEATAMVKTVKMLEGQEKETEEYSQRLMGGQSKIHNFNNQLGLATSLFYFVFNVFIAVGIIMGIQCVRGTSFCPVEITGSRYKQGQFLTVFYQILFCTFNFLQLGSNYSAIKSAIDSSKVLYRFIDEPKREKKQETFSLPQHIGQIQFKNVSFSYPLTEKRILEKFSLKLLHHKFNVISGQTGTGKSTVVNILLKQYQLQAGCITIDGVPLEKINTKYWLSKVGIVAQEPVLFDGTIRDNVLVGKADATDQEVNEALRNANILDFVDSLQEGLDFEIGAGGSKLSGGQKQRIAIARALIKQPQLLILDEATSALDPNAEKEIQESIDRIMKIYERRTTILCIAHRLRTIKNADKIFLIQNCAIGQQGKFEELEYFRQIREKQEYQEQKIDHGHMLNTVANVATTALAKIPEQPHYADAYQQRSIYSYLYAFTVQRKWYIFCLFLAALTGLNHIIVSILISYSTSQMGLLSVAGKFTDWCENPIIIGNVQLQRILSVWSTHEQCENSLDEYVLQAEKYMYGLLGLSVLIFLVYLVKVTMLARIDSEISLNLRKKLFKKLMSIEVRFFQQAQNESGQAAGQFSSDSEQCSVLLTTYVPILVENFCIAGSSVVVCFVCDWRFGLQSIIVTPLIALSFYIAMLFIGGYEDSSLQERHKADQIANELITSFKAVLVLDYQQRLLEKYRQAISIPFWDTLKTGGKIGLLYGSGLFILDVAVGLSLYIATLITKDNFQMTPLTINIFLVTSVFSGFIIGNNFFFISHITASRNAGERIMKLINTQTQAEIQTKRLNQANTQLGQAKGKIEMKNVSFKYKEDGKLVLNNISLVIEAGSKVAFVGPSGCGKSTLLQLLLRFYDFEGEILFDGRNIYDYDLHKYRGFFTVLNQEPSLFAGTIDDNVRYNNTVGEERMQAACKRSCAFTLDEAEPLQERITKFRERKVGPKGSNISGGEKQRTACARALVRGGAVFVMDEGTSALDRETELRVQSGVFQEFGGKTVINVAHRMETIANSDVIFVLDAGRLKEMGSYNELMRRKTYFYNFVNGHKHNE